MVVIGLLVGAFLSPFYITFFLGSEVDVPVKDIMIQILIIIVIPLAAAYITQKLILKKYGMETFKKKIKPVFPLFSTFFVVVILFVAMSLKAELLVNNPSILLDIIIPLVILYALMMTISVFTARLLFNRSDGIAMVNGTLIRNLSLALVIILSAFPDAGIAALLIAISYVLQVQIAAWNVKVTKYLFKSE
jgi:ACR3 family arsenite efflux pump ArsB